MCGNSAGFVTTYCIHIYTHLLVARATPSREISNPPCSPRNRARLLSENEAGTKASAGTAVESRRDGASREGGPCDPDRLSSPKTILTEQDSRECSAGANSVHITPHSPVSEAHNTREFFLGQISTHVASSNQFHFHLVDLTKHHSI